MTDNEVLEGLKAATRRFESRAFEEAIDLIQALPAEGGELGHSILLVCEGLTLEGQGQAASAIAKMEEALASAATTPEILRELTLFFSRAGRDHLAHYAFLMHDLMAPGELGEFARNLPQNERARYLPWALRSSWSAPKPSHYRLVSLKAALAERAGDEASAVVLAGLRGGRDRRVATEYPLVSLQAYARERGRDYREVIPASDVDVAPLSILGRADLDGYRARSRALFTVVLANIIVSSKSNLLLTGQEALLDVQDDERELVPADLRVDPIVAAVDHGAVIVAEPADRGAVRRLPAAVWLMGVHSSAFGHWMIEFLPKVWALMSRHDFARIPILVDQRMPHQHFEALRFFLGAEQPVVQVPPGESVWVDQLWVASQVAYQSVGALPGSDHWRKEALEPRGFARLLARTAPAIEKADGAKRPSRIYLGRKEGQRRGLVNADVIVALVEKHGFEQFEFGALPFAEQMRIIRAADFIIAPDGSQLLTALFARPGTQVIMLTHTYPESYDWTRQACRAVGVEMTVMAGEVVREDPLYRWFADYRIEPSHVAELIRALE